MSLYAMRWTKRDRLKEQVDNAKGGADAGANAPPPNAHSSDDDDDDDNNDGGGGHAPGAFTHLC